MCTDGGGFHVQILKICKEAIASKEEGDKIIIIDIELDLLIDILEILQTQLFFYLFILIGDTEREREEHEWRNIFAPVGFEIYKILPLVSIYSVIELYM
ncbi:putative trans-resveratrol di-O-methyltransferase [Dioscorea sansibarensis]